MKLIQSLFLASLALAVIFSSAEGRSRHHRHHSKKHHQEAEPSAAPVQQEEPKPVEVVEPSPEPEPEKEKEVVAEEKPRPARARKTPILCNTNAAAANLAKPDQVPTKKDEKMSFEVIEPESPESMEIEPISENLGIEMEPMKPKKLQKPKAKVVPTSDEVSSAEEDDDEDDENDSGNNFSAALASLEEPAAPKALTSSEIPDQKSSRAAVADESVEEPVKPKARRSKHNRSDIRRIERPYRKRIVFHSDEE